MCCFSYTLITILQFFGIGAILRVHFGFTRYFNAKARKQLECPTMKIIQNIDPNSRQTIIIKVNVNKPV